MKRPSALAKFIGFRLVLLCEMVCGCAAVVSCGSAFAQDTTPCKDSYRVIARRWDAILRMGWEIRQDCAHPSWPATLVSLRSMAAGPVAVRRLVMPTEQSPAPSPLLIRAGDQVRLWMEDGPVRIEMRGEAEQSARNGEHVIVRTTRQSDEAGLTVQRIPGIVRGAGNVEMERW